jgi:hypothetical protein
MGSRRRNFRLVSEEIIDALCDDDDSEVEVQDEEIEGKLFFFYVVGRYIL